MKIAFDGQFFLKGKKTGIAWSADNVIKSMASQKDINRQINCFGLGYNMQQKEQVYKYACAVKMCNWFHDVVYRMIWNYVPIPYRLFFGKDVEVSIFFNFIVPPGVYGKKIAVVHDMAYMSCPETVRTKTRKYLQTSMKKSCERADKIITISQFSKQEILRHLSVDESKIEVIPWGVDFAAFHNGYTKEQVEQVTKKYSIPTDYILYLGTIEPRKNIERLIYAYSLLNEKDSDMPVLVLAGQKGWYYDEIFAAVERLSMQEKVKFLGYVPSEDAPLLLNGAKLFVFPSLYEGFGLPPLEAMACGTPVVTANAASLPEIAKDAAVLVEPMSVESIAEGIELLLNDRKMREKLISEGLKRAREYTWEKAAERIVNICRELVEK